MHLSRTRWVVANILGVAIGYGVGHAAMVGLTLLADTIHPLQMASGVPVGWSFVLLAVLATLGGAAGAVAGYGLRQRLSRRQYVARNAARYALVGAVCWPILATLHAAVLFFLIGPLSDSLFAASSRRAAFEFLFTLELVSSAILMSLPVGLAIAILTRKEVG